MQSRLQRPFGRFATQPQRKGGGSEGEESRKKEKGLYQKSLNRKESEPFIGFDSFLLKARLNTRLCVASLNFSGILSAHSLE